MGQESRAPVPSSDRKKTSTVDSFRAQVVIRVMSIIVNIHSPSPGYQVPSHPGITSTETLISPLIISAGRQSVKVSDPEVTVCILKCNMISSQHNNVAGWYLGIVNKYLESTIFASIGTSIKCNLQYTTICK